MKEMDNATLNEGSTTVEAEIDKTIISICRELRYETHIFSARKITALATLVEAKAKLMEQI